MPDQTKATGFAVPEPIMDALTATPHTALEIGAALVVCRFGDGATSTAGHSAVSRYLGCSVPAAEGALSRLAACGIIDAIPVPTRKALNRVQPRWRLVADRRKASPPLLWLSTTLVDGHGRVTQPLRRLKSCGDVAARLAILIHRRVDWRTFTAVPPVPNIHTQWKPSEKPVGTIGGMDLYRCREASTQTYHDIAQRALGLAQTPKDWTEALPPFWQALERLETAGFVYRVAMVLDADPGTDGAAPLYTLRAVNRHGLAPDGEDGLAGALARLGAKLGHTVTDAEGRFTGDYLAAVDRGFPCHVAGLFRPRFRADAYNVALSEGWRTMRAMNTEWRERILAAEREAGT